MKLHPSVIKAVNGVSMDSASEEEACARRVLRAQAQPEAIPDGAVEDAAFSMCQSGKFECGQGRCAPICMEFMGHKPKKCAHALRVHGDMARAVISTALLHIAKEGE